MRTSRRAQPIGVVAREFAGAAACVLWLFVMSTEDKALCSVSSGAPQAVEAIDTPDQTPDRADQLARELATLATELEKARIGTLQAIHAIESDISQRQALEQEHARAEALAHEVISLRAERDAARAASAAAAETTGTDFRPKQALEQEQTRADPLAGETEPARTEPDAVPSARPEGTKAATINVEQKQALERELDQERDKTSALSRELSAVRAELETARASGLEAVHAAEAAKVEQQLALGKERAKTGALANELASARKDAEERSARLAAAHAEALRVTDAGGANLLEQKQALASERDRAEALARELSSVKNEIESDRKQIAGLKALIPQLRESVDISSPMRGADPSAAESPSPEAQPLPAVREAAAERAASTNAAGRSRVDEEKLLARANALLRLADISGARPLLEHAVEHGSARAAFMLAETYDAHVLQLWRVRGISGDLAMARKLYERAQAGGIEDAKERIEALR